MDEDPWYDGYDAGFANAWHEISQWIMLWMDEERYEAGKRKDINMVRFIDRFKSCLDAFIDDYKEKWNVQGL